jgi:hypothetical protein
MPRFRLIAVSALAALTLGTGTAVAVAAQPERPVTAQTYAVSSANQGVTVDAGPILRKKYGFRTEWLGTLTVDGHQGICVDYGKRSPDGTWSTGNVPGVSGRTDQRMAWLVNAYWSQAMSSDKYAAALKSATNRLASAEFRSDWSKSYVKQLKGKGIVELADDMLAKSNAAGNVAVVGQFADKPLPGGSGTYVVTAKGAGQALAGQRVRFTAKGATVGKTATTNSAGKASVRFTRTSVGAVTLRAAVDSPDWRKVYVSSASSGHQHLIRGGYTVSTSVGGSYDSTFGLTVNQSCDTVCNGRPPVTFTAKASGAPVKWQALAGGKVVKTLTLKAGGSGTAKFTGSDGQRVTFRYSVKTGANWSGYRVARTFDVVCPPWPAITVTKTCPCKGTPVVTYRFTGTGRYDVVTLNGKTAALNPGQKVTLTATAPKGATVTAGFDAYSDAGRTKRVGGGVLDSWMQAV